jgi:hypothetical protein
MPFKWATWTYRAVLLPSFYTHHLYWQRKVALDQIFEKRSGWSNFMTGVVAGGVLYMLVSPFRPMQVDKATSELNGEAAATLALLGIDPKQEMAVVAFSELTNKVVAQIHIANDKAQMRRHQLQVEALRELQQQHESKQAAASQGGQT